MWVSAALAGLFIVLSVCGVVFVKCAWVCKWIVAFVRVFVLGCGIGDCLGCVNELLCSGNESQRDDTPA